MSSPQDTGNGTQQNQPDPEHRQGTDKAPHDNDHTTPHSDPDNDGTDRVTPTDENKLAVAWPGLLHKN